MTKIICACDLGSNHTQKKVERIPPTNAFILTKVMKNCDKCGPNI